MLEYSSPATTIKNISRFTYDLYSCINVNKLKYNNDSSAVLRVMSVFIDALTRPMEDLGYQITFTMTGMEFVNISRLSGFRLSDTPGIKVKSYVGITAINNLIGLSKYTDKEYPLKYVDNATEFIRHSLPCDMFLSGEKDIEISGIYTLPPNVEIPVQVSVKESVLTLRVIGGVEIASKEDPSMPISIVVRGLGLSGKELCETVDIINDVDVQTKKEYTLIYSVMVINCNCHINLRVFPYVTGENVLTHEKFVDREDGDEYRTVIGIDYTTKQLNINALKEVSHEYPNKYETVRKIPLVFDNDTETIHSYYCDIDNKLLYVITNRKVSLFVTDKILYCFPLLIPSERCNILDKFKTEYQAITVEYYEDTLDEKYVFYIFPTDKTNGVELLNIKIKRISDTEYFPSWTPSVVYTVGNEVAYNGVAYTCVSDHTSLSTFQYSMWTENEIEYKSDMLLDLLRENIETNRLEIPFSDLFTYGADKCIVEFSTYGEAESVLPIFLYNAKLKPLYAKNLNDMRLTWDESDKTSTWVEPEDTNAKYDYNEYLVGGLGFGEGPFGGDDEETLVKISFGGIMLEGISDVDIYKYSTSGNIIINGAKVVNVFDTFYYDEENNMIVTSDSISYLRAEGEIQIMEEDE